MIKKLIVLAIVAVTIFAAVMWLDQAGLIPSGRMFGLRAHPHEFSAQADFEAHGSGATSFGAKPEAIRDTLRVLFVGDTSFGENYQRPGLTADNANPMPPMWYDNCLKKLTPLLSRADVVIANLETPITDLSSSPLAGKKSYIHWSDITQAPKALKGHNIRTVSLANNHTLDYGVAGLRQTLNALRRSGIASFGAGLNASQAARPLQREFTIGSNPFQLIAASGFESRWHYKWRYKFYATKETGGVNRWTKGQAADQLRAIRRAHPGAFVVAFPHWGGNYRWKTRGQTKLAHALIDGGADLVIGHGAHMLQEIEYYQDRWIIYSLGNFVFNSPGRYQKEKVDAFSLAARLDVAMQGKDLVLALRLYPIFSDNRMTNYQPRLVTEGEFNRVQELLLKHSPGPEHLRMELRAGKDEAGQYLVLHIGTLDN